MVAAGSITVAVRVRPPTSAEAARLPTPSYETSIRGDGTLSAPARPGPTTNVREIIQILDDRILTFDPPDGDPSRAFVERGFLPPGTKRYKDRRFMFDRVFNHDAQQDDVYCSTAKPLLEPLLNGFNATIFAYGATGCGKTHTISGTDSDPGVIYLTMAELFDRIEERRDEWNVDVIVTFLEIYNEEIRDLLADSSTNTAPRGGLQIREDKSVKVVGLVELRPKTAEEVKQIVLLGNTRRTQSPTHANETSSRSHAVLQVHITQSPRTANVNEERTMGTLSIIDLAGSERAAATTNMGQRMVEGANINKSLLALGNCINALCESGGAVRHVPYRNSKLTRLLKFSLGGNCKTVMIVCVAPTSLHFEDTHNTLIYAERATKIKTKVVTRNVVNVDRHVGRYVEAINRLNAEVAELKAKLAGKSSGETVIAKRKRADADAEVERAKKDLQAKMDQTRPAIVDGASCEGKLHTAKAKLNSVQRRLLELDAQSRDAPLSSDLQAERALLQAMADPEAAALRADSALNIRLQRSTNSGNMFNATLKAVSERRSDRLDEVSTQNVRLDARAIKAEMERARAEAREEATREAFAAQADLIVSLVGMVGRCNVILGDASRSLASAAIEDPEVVSKIATSLSAVASQNDLAFTSLVNQSTAAYSTGVAGASSLHSYKPHPIPAIQPSTVTVSTAAQGVAPAPKSKPTRRSSVAIASPRRSFKSPRRSLRNSLTNAGPSSRRVGMDEKARKKKTVQWRDDAGHGNLDDGGNDPFAMKKTDRDMTPMASLSSSSSTAAGPPAIPRPSSVAGSVTGSESEWEDDKLEVGLGRNNSLGKSTTLLAGLVSGTGPKRRTNRFDPSFLKGEGSSNLSSLAEEREELTPRRPAPLGDIMNREEPPSPTISALHVPKVKDGLLNGSPHKRMPNGAAVKTHARRRSNVGPIRPEKVTRRRSSAREDSEDERLIPIPLSPRMVKTRSSGSGVVAGPRRVVIEGVKSPAKRAKRLSLLGAAAARSMKARQNTNFLMPPTPATDPNSSADISISSARPSSRAAWR